MRTYLDIPPGINSDETGITVGDAAWGDGSLIRFPDDRPETIGGWERALDANLSGVCRTALPWTDIMGALVVAFGTHSHLQVTRGGELFDITPTGLAPGAEHGTGTAGYGTGAYSTGAYSQPSTDDYFARTWSLDTWGESLMASPRGGKIYWWQNDTAVPAAALNNAPDEVTFMLVNEQRQVMAFGCNEEVSGDFNPLAIRFADIENPEDWTTTPANNAGEEILKGGGRLVGARKLGPHIFAWTDNSLYRGVFVGDPSQTWRFDLVDSGCGLIGPNAAVVVGQVAYWIAPDTQLYACPLDGAPQVLKCTVRKAFTKNLAASQADKIVASRCAAFSEIRFDYPDARDGYENSRYISVCTKNGAWAKGQMARTAYVDAGPAVSPIGVSPAGAIYWHERGNSSDGDCFCWFLESASQYISGERRCLRVNDVEPDFLDQVGPVNLTVFTREFAQDPDEAWDPITLAPGEQFQDFRAEGRFIRVRFEGEAVPSFVRFGRISFDTMETGQR